MTEALIQIAQQHGPWVAIVAYMLWAQRQTMRNMQKDYTGVCVRLNSVEDYCKETLTKLLEKTMKAVERNNELIEKCNRH